MRWEHFGYKKRRGEREKEQEEDWLAL